MRVRRIPVGGSLNCACRKELKKIAGYSVYCACTREKYFSGPVPDSWVCELCWGGTHVDITV